ncbi:MAG: calcium-binding EGF-like domain-containing protein [Bacteroidota bacterium]
MRITITFLAFSLMLLPCCTIEDPCEDLKCINQGRCRDGSCDCAAGFEGDNCEIREIEKYLGTYLRGQGSCNNVDFVLGTHVITEHPFENRMIVIDDGVLDVPITAEVDGWNFVIPRQQNGYTDPQTNFSEDFEIWGQGWIDLQAGLLIYKLDNTGCEYQLELPN